MRLTYRPEIVEDIRSLPSPELQHAATQLLFDVAPGTVIGKELDYRVVTGDLRDCYKVYFGVPGQASTPACRLVYRLLPNAVEAVAVEAVAIGPRQDLGAHVAAAQRLERIPLQEP